MRKAVFLLGILLSAIGTSAQETTQGSLYAANRKGKQIGECPLKSTQVQADISSFIARVNVRQEFQNSFAEPIEAVYTFPLSQNGAVDNMTMTIGTRVIRSKIMKREDARQVYEAAKSEGMRAGLLDQERPNVFTQSVANIMPGDNVVIEISYVETLKYEDGAYEFVFPMTVGPRYIPGSVKDAAKISPPLATSRNGSDMSIEVNINAGVPVEEIRSSSHVVDQINFTPAKARITLRSEKTIPNKDFILRYDVTGKRIEDALLATRGARGGFFTLVLQPPEQFASEDITPKEIVFVLDTSGSMSGFPIEKAKEAMKMSLDGLYPNDTFNLITFAGDTSILFDAPVPATQANLEQAWTFLESRHGAGGTEMMKAVQAALERSDSREHVRIVCFMTDGLVGNDEQIIAEVKKHPNARVFSFGIGESVNRYLLDKIAEVGNGEVQYVSLKDDGSRAATKFYERVRTPLLTDLSLDWNGLPVADVYPRRIPDLFSAKPVVVTGRFTKASTGSVRLKGRVAGQEYSREIAVRFPESEPANEVLGTLWARKTLDELMMKRAGADAAETAKIADEITKIGLEFRLLTDNTSFVAVEEKVVNRNGVPVKVEVPVPVPEGVDPATFREDSESLKVVSQTANFALLSGGAMTANVTVTGNSGNSRKSKNSGRGTGYGSGAGNGSGSGTGSGPGSGSGTGSNPPPPAKVSNLPLSQRTMSTGVINGSATNLPEPEYPAAARAVHADGKVQVHVTIDEAGNVISASAVSGHPLLRAAAMQAAKIAQFTPTMLSGNPVKVSGVITYSFVDPSHSAHVTAATGAMLPADLGPAQPPKELAEMRMKTVFHSWVYALVSRPKAGNGPPSTNEEKFVRDGRARIQIALSAKSPELLERLKSLGFELTAEKKGGVVGIMPVERIAALADVSEVKLVLPALW